MAKPGKFITLEGGEGSGKSSQILILRDALIEKGYNVITTREPGGTPEAEKIRHLLVHREGGNWDAMAECLLLFAGRRMHVEGLIKPELAKGTIVISDRFADSTRAYQGFGGSLPLSTIEEINALSLGAFAPDLTFILDLPVETGLARAGRRIDETGSGEDRFESKGLQFHQRMRDGYLEIAKTAPQRCVVVDAARTPQEISEDLFKITIERLGL